MPRKLGNVTRDKLVNAALPTATKSYTVISHSYAINTILQALEDNNFKINEETYRCSVDGQIGHGTFIIDYQGDPDLSMAYSFSNSYNKKLKFKAAVGAFVSINGAQMISEMDHWKRKHTGTADEETEEVINDQISNAQQHFDQLLKDKEAMKLINIDRNTFGHVIGELYINGYLETDQISIIKREYSQSAFNYTTSKDCLWTCYNHVVYALRKSHPVKWMKNQIAVHLYFCSKFNLTQFDEEVVEEVLEENEGVDTLPGADFDIDKEENDSSQTNLEDAIAEADKETSEEPVVEDMVKNEEGNAALLKAVDDHEEFYFEKEECGDDVKVGDVIVIEGTHYDVTGEDIDKDISYWVATEANTTLEEEKVVVEPAIIDEVVDNEVEIETDEVFDIKESPSDNSLPIPPVQDKAVTNEVKEEEVVEEKEDPDAKDDWEAISKEVVQNPIVESSVELSEKTDAQLPLDPTKIAIATELEAIYGYVPEFTYTSADDQYNIVLESGESLVLSAAYIDSNAE
jgi:hypothetical protein